MFRTRITRRRAALAALAGGLLTLGLATPAMAHTPAGVEPPEPPSDLTISGIVTLNGCVTATSNVKVLLHGLTYPFEDATVSASFTNGKIRYTKSALPRGKYRVTGKLLGNDCPFGDWTPRFTTAPSGANQTKTANISYKAPQAQWFVSGDDVAATFDTAFDSAQITLDNFGPLHGKSFFKANASKLKYPRRTAITTSIPESVLPYGYSIMKTYVDNVFFDHASAEWSNGGIDLHLFFEDFSTEIPSFLFGLFDNSITPDNELSLVNIRMDVRLVPALDNGRFTYQVVGTPSLHGLPEQICVHLGDGPNICPTLDAVWSNAETQMSIAVKKLFSTTTARRQFADIISSIVPIGIRNKLTKVVVVGDDVALVMN